MSRSEEALGSIQLERPAPLVRSSHGEGESRSGNLPTNTATIKYKIAVQVKRRHDNDTICFPVHPEVGEEKGDAADSACVVGQGFAKQVLEASDHLCQVAKITRPQIKKLESVGDTTLTQLATEKIDAVQASEPTRAIWTELSLVIAESIRQSEHVAKIPLVRNGCFGRQGKSNLKGCAFVDD